MFFIISTAEVFSRILKVIKQSRNSKTNSFVMRCVVLSVLAVLLPLLLIIDNGHFVEASKYNKFLYYFFVGTSSIRIQAIISTSSLLKANLKFHVTRRVVVVYVIPFKIERFRSFVPFCWCKKLQLETQFGIPIHLNQIRNFSQSRSNNNYC